MNQKYHLLLLLVLTVLLPASLFARKKHDKGEETSLLTFDEQQHFDSLYIQAITLGQRHLPDSAAAVMQQAVEYYSAAILDQKYMVQQHMPTSAEPELPKGFRTPSARQVPGLAAAYYYLSRYYRKQNNALLSVLNIDYAVAIDSVNYWYTEAEGSLYMALGRMDDARICYERLVRNFPAKSEPLYNMSEIYLRLDSVDLCLQTLNQLEELEGVNPQLTQYKFAILQENGRTEEGFDQYRKLIERYPYNVQYRVHMGDLQMQNGQIQQAKQTYDAASAIEPDNAYVWVAQANYYTVTGDQPAADSLVASALTNANLDVETKTQVMEEYLKGSFRKLQQYRDQVAQGNVQSQLDTLLLFSTVDSLFSEVASMHPTAGPIYELQAEWRSAMGQDSLATECMRFAVDLKPTSQDYRERLLYYCTSWMPKEQIVELTQEVQEQFPACQTAYLVAAWAYVQLEQQAKAIEQYKLAIDNMTPPDANRVSQLWGNIGDLYYQLEMRDTAYVCYDKAVKYNPNNYAVLNNYAYYLSTEQKDLSKAEQMSLKVIQKFPDNPTYLDTYAWILCLEGSYTLAIFYQQHAIDCIEPGNTDYCTLYDHYGDMLVKNHDLKGAVVQWRKALECSDCDDPALIQKKIESAELLSK